MTARIRHAQIVGTGLIGGSIAMALKSLGWHVTGRDKVPENATKALSLGAIDLIGSDPEAEFTFVAVPASSVEEEVRRALDETVGFVTDTGSVKASITSAISNPRFIPGHPMAGSEQDGVNGSDPKIFAGAVWVLTPSSATEDNGLRELQTLLGSIGSDVVTMDAERHDALVAVVSHVPHLTAAAMMCMADDRANDDTPLLRLAAGGFRDMTRIAAGNPRIWLDICQENRLAIVSALDELSKRLGEMREIVAGSDVENLNALLSQARRARNNLPARYVRPQDLIEVRVSIPDKKGQIAKITMLAADCDVNVADIEVAHSAEGSQGVLVLVVSRNESQRFLTALAGMAYNATIRELA